MFRVEEQFYEALYSISVTETWSLRGLVHTREIGTQKIILIAWSPYTGPKIFINDKVNLGRGQKGFNQTSKRIDQWKPGLKHCGILGGKEVKQVYALKTKAQQAGPSAWV